jgi:alpha-galactosidase/6-phospho-beta-glucosidase family protein
MARRVKEVPNSYGVKSQDANGGSGAMSGMRLLERKEQQKTLDANSREAVARRKASDLNVDH